MEKRAILPISNQVFSKLNQIQQRYSDLRYEKLCEVPMQYTELKDIHYRQAPLGEPGVEFADAPKGTKWGGDWITAWFCGSFTVPAAAAGRKLFVRANTDGESLFIANGEYKGVFDVNHPVRLVTLCAREGEKIDLAFEAYSGHFCPNCMPTDAPTYVQDKCKTFGGTELLLEREDVSEFVYDFMTLRMLLTAMDPNSLRRNVILRELVKVYNIVDMYPDEKGEASWRPKLRQADAILKEQLSKKNGDTMPYMGIVGHSHMDTAWLWPSRETWRKCARTFSSALSLMDEYPEFIFVQSSPAQTEKIKDLYPSIFEGIQKRAAEGRYESNGGMWVEPDCNIPSGEALARQLIMAQKYTMKWFGYKANTLWMPDVFGYSGSLPQLLQLADMPYFCTTKIAWNDTTRHPYDTFTWKGIDGTSVLSHFNIIHCWPSPDTFIGTWNNLKNKDNQDRRLVSYGYGDGGGGPMAEMIEVARRCADLEGCPTSSHTTVGAFMDSLAEREEPFPVWSGELYLECHRGTLTSISAIKKNNRRAEFALRAAELAGVIAEMKTGAAYPADRLEEMWKTLLMNQFHDILPGSSIKEVNDQAIAEVGEVIQGADAITKGALTELSSPCEDSLSLFNTLSWPREGEIVLESAPEGMVPADGSCCQRIEGIDGKSRLAICGPSVPGMGAADIALRKGDAAFASPFVCSGSVVETPFATVTFDDNGAICSFIDKPSGRELVPEGGLLNSFMSGEDVPEAWDNWNIDVDQANKMSPDYSLISSETVADGPLQLRIRNRWKVAGASYIDQDIVFHSATPRVDFDTRVDWHEKHTLLKASFDLDILCDNSRSEIQYGFAERPTHKNQLDDVARFEVCNHKWSDLSETGFGCALINDCKYGLSAEEKNLSLTLLKSGTHPDPRGDNGEHFFRYALLPHGAFSAESVIRPAYEFNEAPVETPGVRAEAAGLLSVSKPNVIVEAVKKTEDGSGITVRMYEAEKTGVCCDLECGFDFASASITNLLEEELEPAAADGRTVHLSFRPFEIKTLVFRL
ncbi:MAG: alpha-mannosidase [Abditibacteriota bacterium]|nr:alpha-mannosidase [Abditibacteriota bacterium]